MQELPGRTFQNEGVSLELFNQIPSNFYTLECMEDIATMDGVSHTSSRLMNHDRYFVALCESVHSSDWSTNPKSEINYGNVHKFTINFQTTNLTRKNTFTKSGSKTFRGFQRVEGSEIISECSVHDEATGYTAYARKSVNLYPTHITHYIYEDIVLSGHHHRFDLFSRFKKVRRSKRNIKCDRFVILPVMYH